MSIQQFRKTTSFAKLLLIVGLLTVHSQSAEAGFFSWLKSWNSKKSEKVYSISGSTIALTAGSPIDAGTTGAVNFRVTTVSNDNEYIPSITITLPAGWTAACNSDDGGLHSDAVACSPSSNAVTYTFTGTTYPGLRNGDIWNCTVDITVPSGVTAGNYTINYLLTGDGFGSNPHTVSSSMTIAVVSPNGPGESSCANSDEVGGIVFEDYDANGILDNNEPFYEGILVAIFDDNGQVGVSQNTDSNGEYLFTGLATGTYRVELTVPDYLKESLINTDSKTSVQFVQTGSCDNSLGVFYPNQYCETNDPPIVISCYEDGNAVYGATGNTGKSLVSMPYSSSGATPTGISEVAKIHETGSVWGIAWQPTNQRMFVSSLLKRYTGLGNQGEGGIYVMDFSSATGSYSTSFDLDGISPANGGSTIDFGSVNRTGTDYALPNDNTTSSWDIDAFGKIGKVGIGDADLSPDGNTLWLVNLNQRALIATDVSNPASYPGTTRQYPLSAMTGVPSCTNGVLRPWAISFYKDKGYVGCVCTGENSGTAANMRAYVLSFDPDNPTTLTNEIDFALNYTRENAVDFDFYGLLEVATWRPWVDTWAATGLGNTPSSEVVYAQPILGDIDFMDDGSMVLGFIDRFGFQMGASNYIPVSTQTSSPSVDAAGDLIKICRVGNSWVMEGGAGCGENDNTSRSALGNDGPSGTGEFFYEDSFDDTGQNPTYNHNETFIGGLKVLKGSNEVLAGHYDPVNGNGFSFDLGLIWHNATDGSRSDDFIIVLSGASASKGNNLGSLEAVCAPAPIEIGNYVWNDTDGDGLQDPSEEGLVGVTVTFTDASDVVLGTTTTDSEGKYIFNNANITGNIEYNTNYKVKISLANVQSIDSKAQSVALANQGNGINDNDATLVGSTAVASITTGGSGETSYAVDFGFSKSSVIGNRVWLDEDGDGDQDAGEVGIPNVVVELVSSNCTAGVDCPTTITDANGGYLFKNIGPGTYTVQVIAGLPTGAILIYDEDNLTVSPDGTTSVTVNFEEYLSADFGYNYASKADTDNPANTSINGGIGDRVWNDANSNGVQDPGEAGLDNISINLYNDHDLDGVFDNLVSSSTTDANGRYFFDGLVPGAYVVEVVEADISAAGFTTSPTADPDNDQTNRSNPVVIAPGDIWMGGDFGYNNASDPADIGSTVFVDVDGNGSYNASNDLPLGGVTIALVKDTDGEDDWDVNEELVATTITAADGSYLFPDLPAGDYVVVVTDINNIINLLSNSVDPQGGNDGISGLSLGGSNNLVQNFGYVPSGHTNTKAFIGDLIFLDQDGGDDYDIGEPGIEGVEVLLLDGDTDLEIASTFTNENGQYFFGNLDAANYKIQINTSSLPAGLINSTDPDGSSPPDDETDAFSLAAGTKDLSQDFGYKASTPRTISGTLWEDANAEGTLDGTESDRFANVTMILLDGNNNIIAQTLTDGSGAYTFTGVPSGSYTVEVTDDAAVLEGYWHSPIANDNESDPIVVDASSGNVANIDFGYYAKAAALGNFVWLDYNGDGIQGSDEPGLEGAKITLEIDYDGGGADLSVVQLAGLNGAYSFDHLLLDEDYQGDGAGTEPTFTLKVEPPNNHAFYASSLNTDSGGNDNLDADDDSGVSASPQQGLTDVALTNVTATQTSYDFAFDFDCSMPSVEYAVTQDGSNGMAGQTTDHFLAVVDGDTIHTAQAQKYGIIRSYTYCTHGDWNYYFNPLDPEEYLFAIRHNTGGGGTSNTTAIEYIELRMDDNPTDRFSIGADDASFVMMRDWRVKTKDDVALSAPIDVRFYFPENEFAEMFNAAVDQAVNTWGGGTPVIGDVKWFKKEAFAPDSDVDDDGSILLPHDISSLQNMATNALGTNTADTNTDGAQDIGQNKNHIQFNAITGSSSGGTALFQINRAALPVTLTEFKLDQIGCSVNVNWVTESEENFDHFELQWSGDGKTFAPIKTIEANGGNFSQAYHYKDNAAASSNYYRLKMVDKDGTFGYSNVEHIETDCEVNHGLNIYPNPVLKNITILNLQLLTQRTEVQIELTDMMGRTLKRFSLKVEPGFINNLRIDIADLPSGTYSVLLAGEKEAKLFIIQE